MRRARRPSPRGLGAALGATLGAAWMAAAGPITVAHAEGRPADGRAFTWGMGLVAPISLADPRDLAGRAISLVAPGGGVEGHVGFEWPEGVTLDLVGGITAQASTNAGALVSERALAEFRWAVDTGTLVAPTLGLGAGLELTQLESRVGVTAVGRARVGLEIMLAGWLSLDAGVSMDVVLPGDAFGELLARVIPSLGVRFYE